MIKNVVTISYIYFRQSSAHSTNLWIIIITWIFFAASFFRYWQYLIIYLIWLFKVFYWIYYNLNYIFTFYPIWNSFLNIYLEITFEISIILQKNLPFKSQSKFRLKEMKGRLLFDNILEVLHEKQSVFHFFQSEFRLWFERQIFLY